MSGAIDFSEEPLALAARLIGAELYVDGVGGLIVETEAYSAEDPASHSFNGPKARNASMFGPVGRAYVYRSYGMHWCLNLVCGETPGGAVLVRAIEPLAGLDIMRRRRGLEASRALCSGPGKLCQALGVSIAHDGLSLTAPPFAMTPAKLAYDVVAGPRVGITRAADRPWRFGMRGSGHLSRAFPAPGFGKP